MSPVIKRSVFLALTIILAAYATNGSAGWVDKQGNAVPDSPHQKSSRDYIAQLVVTDKEEEVLKNWGTPSESVYFPTANKIQRNRIITAFVVFGGCAEDPGGNCFLVMTVTVFRPDGSVYSRMPDMEVWENKPVPPDRSLGLSRDYLRVIIEDEDPLGEYTIEAIVEDLMTGKELTLVSKFQAIESDG